MSDETQEVPETGMHEKSAVDYVFSVCRYIIEKGLMQNHPAIVKSLAAMVSARQLYGMAVTILNEEVAAIPDKELERLLRKHDEQSDLTPTEEMDLSTEAVRGTVVEYLTQAAAEQAREFDMGEVLETTQKALLPWLVEDAAPYIQRRNKNESLRQRDEDARERLLMPVQLPFGVNGAAYADEETEATASVLRRGEYLVLTGWRPAVLFLLDMLRNPKFDEPQDAPITLRLSVFKPSPDRPGREDLVELVDWSECCKTNASLMDYLIQAKGRVERTTGNWVTADPDLFVIDDIRQAAPKMALPGDDLRLSAVNEAIKKSRRAVTLMGAAAVVGFPLDERVPPELDHRWSTLMAHTTLRRVYVKETEDFYELTIECSRYTVYVPRKVLTPSPLIKDV